MTRFEIGQDTIPGQPVLTAASDPPSGAFHDNVVFTWQTVSRADRYELWIASIQTGRVLLEETTATTMSIDLNTLRHGFNAYRAWVRAIGSDGTRGEWSERIDLNVAHFTDGRHAVFFP